MPLKKKLLTKLSRLIESMGYTVLPHWRVDRQPLARHLRALFDRYRVDAVFDVGGNLGQYHDLLRDEVAFSGWIFSFEPVRKYAEHLKKRSANEHNWRVFEFALGSAEGSAEIHVTKSPGLNSFLEPRTDVNTEFWQADAVSGKEVVSIRRLDQIFSALQEDCGFHSPYLKLDTQGFDLEVLKGGLSSLAAIPALQVEAAIRPLYKGMPTYQDILQYTSQAGFELSGMFPVTHDDALRLIEFDCILTNSLFARERP